MIDRLYARYGQHREKPLDPNYRPEDSIIGRVFLNPGSDKLTVVIPGWHNHANSFLLNKLSRRLVKKGWAVLIYDFHDQILEPDEKLVVESFKYIRQKVSADIAELAAKYGYKEINLTGISLGTVTWAMIADTYRDFTSATIVVGGDDLAVDMWHGIRTQHYRRALEKLHVGVRRLDQEWEGIAPVNHLKHFKGKNVKIVLSLNDKFILTKYQKKLLERLIENGAQVKLKKSFFGHILTILRYCYFDSPL